jgi:hypothetical protein
MYYEEYDEKWDDDPDPDDEDYDSGDDGTY